MSILLPLWGGYLVKVYAWRLILAQNGVLNWLLEPFGLKGPGYSDVAVWLVESYLWLPYMIIPISAGLERIPGSLLEASSDLGGRSGMTFRRVILPLAFPAVVAGSIFTFSLTLGDYITPHARLEHAVHRQRRLRLRRRRRQPAARGRVRDGPGHDHARVPAARPPPRRVRVALMVLLARDAARPPHRDDRDAGLHLRPDRR